MSFEGGGDFGFDEPIHGLLGIGADQEDFLDGSGGNIKAFESGPGWVLDFEAGGGFAFADVNSARNDPGNIGAIRDDFFQEPVEAGNPAVLAFDSPEFHRGPV